MLLFNVQSFCFKFMRVIIIFAAIRKFAIIINFVVFIFFVIYPVITVAA